ncbi:MAG: hypothetical protein N2383_01170 [Caldilineales bacterium]|nr:hypothetical protein [Caldilineales bacterium]
MANVVLLNQAETELRQALAQYAHASRQRELATVVRRLRLGLEQALRAQFETDRPEADFLALAEALIPTYVWRLQALIPVLAELERKPGRVSPMALRATAASLANIAVNVWPRLFQTAPPPLVHPPAAGAALGRVERSPVDMPTAAHPDWEDLTLWVVLSLLIPWLLGLTLRWWAIRVVPRVIPLLLAVMALTLVYLWLRSLWGLITRFGLVRLLVVGTLTAAAIAVGLGFWGSAQPPEDTVLTRLRYGVRRLPDEVTRWPGYLFSAGAHTGDRVLALLLATSPPDARSVPTPTVPMPNGGEAFRIGIAVVVHTGGSVLRCRSSPGLDHPQVARFADGTRLTLVAGPREADGLRWWQVAQGDLRCWSAETFLRPGVVGDR